MAGKPGPHSGKCASTTCPTCGKEFWYYLSWPRKYCSNTCKGVGGITNIKHWQPTGYDATCEECGKTFRAGVSTRGRFCSSRCWGIWSSAHVVGPTHPKFGKKFGRPPHLPPPVTKTCPVCERTFVTKASHISRRRFCSKQCMAADLAMRVRGEDNFNWQGGYEPYYGPTWLAARRAVRERDKVCQMCGVSPQETGRELDVHHIKPFRTFGSARHEEANQLTNLMLLCNTCHAKYEQATNR